MSDLFETSTKVEDYVGEGKKYSTSEKALESIPHKEMHIKGLEEQNRELMAELAKRQTLEEVLENLKKPTETLPTKQQDPDVNADRLYKEIEARLAASLDSKVKETVTASMSGTLQQQDKLKNRQAVNEALKSAFGDKAVEILALKATELGVTVQDLATLAENAPKAVLAYFKSDLSEGSSGSINTEGFIGSKPSVGEGTKVWWDNFRKTAPTKYWEPKMQTKMFQDRKRLGDKF